MKRQRILFDEGPIAGGTEFSDPVRLIRADEPREVPAALCELSSATAHGHWLAGFASYELGYVLTPRLAPLLPDNRDTPLLLFGVYDTPKPARRDSVRAGPVRFGPLEPGWSFQEYQRAFERVKEYIAAGDIYQANLTFPMRLQAEGDAIDLYAALREVQPVRHGALVELGGTTLLSRSPEMFFSTDGTGMIETRPMKGTVARGATEAEDRARHDWLAASEKNRAENLMIVDLLRNDISRVAEIGSVKVPELFRIEQYATVYQMTSRVQGRLRPDVRLPDIFRALFPCGSVTGAPKIRATEIIREIEPEPRGVYCGSVGWVAPDGAMSFNVAIRTLVLSQDGSIRFNVGGGVVHDSTAADEYEEALWKARFVTLAQTI
ncbi:MAG: aminodeoxychorismate synthase component I [Paracoccaceae bacterium]